MTTSGLIVFLPLVAAFIGAVIGAFANGLYRDWQDRKARDRERKGLLTLVDAEIDDNRLTLQNAHRLTTSYPPMVPPLNQTLRIEGWTDGKVRLAQLLPTSHIQAIVRYYDLVFQLRTLAEAFTEDLAQIPANTRPPHGFFEPLQRLISRTRVAGENVTVLNQPYIASPGTSPPSLNGSSQHEQG